MLAIWGTQILSKSDNVFTLIDVTSCFLEINFLNTCFLNDLVSVTSSSFQDFEFEFIKL